MRTMLRYLAVLLIGGGVVGLWWLFFIWGPYTVYQKYLEYKLFYEEMIIWECMFSILWGLLIRLVLEWWTEIKDAWKNSQINR